MPDGPFFSQSVRILNTIISQLAEQYGWDVASDVLARSQSNFETSANQTSSGQSWPELARHPAVPERSLSSQDWPMAPQSPRHLARHAGLLC